MKTTFSVLALCYILSSTYTVAQETDSLNWFPYKTGDLWEYWVTDGFTLIDTAQIINIRDSVSADGKIHLTQLRRFINPVMYEDFVDYTIDTATTEVRGRFPFDILWDVPVFKLNAHQGDQWVVKAYGGVAGEMARVTAVYQDTLFDSITTFMNMHYYLDLAGDSTDTLGLSRGDLTLAKGFGLVGQIPSEFGFSYHLKGAIIDGVLYGDTTNIVTSVDDKNEQLMLQGFELHQNYPNPFNPATTITFNLNVSGNASLIIYDAMGREIRRLIDNERFTPGTHKILWDGKTNSGEIASTGAYYYRLLHDGKIFTRSMIFLK